MTTTHFNKWLTIILQVFSLVSIIIYMALVLSYLVETPSYVNFKNKASRMWSKVKFWNKPKNRTPFLVTKEIH